jgi:hypothetical protein
MNGLAIFDDECGRGGRFLQCKAGLSGRKETSMSAITALVVAVGGTLICYLLMTRARTRRANRGSSGDSNSGTDTGGTVGGDGGGHFNWFSGDHSGSGNAGHPGDGGGGGSDGGGGRDGGGGGD